MWSSYVCDCLYDQSPSVTDFHPRKLFSVFHNHYPSLCPLFKMARRGWQLGGNHRHIKLPFWVMRRRPSRFSRPCMSHQTRGWPCLAHCSTHHTICTLRAVTPASDVPLAGEANLPSGCRSPRCGHGRLSTGVIRVIIPVNTFVKPYRWTAGISFD